MSDQHIGVKAQFLTPAFSRGLARYLTGLNRAIAATNATTAAINNLGAQSSAVFAALQGNARATANALRNVANAAAAANRALNPRARRTRAATTTGQQQAGNLNAALAGATTRANQQATQQINAAAQATRNLGVQARQTSISVTGLNAKTIALGTAMGTVAAHAIMNVGSAVREAGSKILEIVTFFERLELSIAFFTARSFQAEDATLTFNEALAMGEREAQGLAIWLQRLAVASPFTTRTVGTIFRTAQAYGLTRREAEQLTPLLLDFGAAAGLNEDILERLALALGQVRSRGKLTGEEVRQLGNSGLPVRDILVKALGIANSEFDELLESGALTSDVVLPHLIEALRDFEGAGARVAFGTIGGIISAMEELREISTAKFFTGFLEPLKESLQELFRILNQPEVLAFITVLGQELGVKFRDVIFGAVEAIRSYITAWQELNPAVKQQIIVFAGATAGVFALAAAFGLLTLAMGVIANPLVLIATTVGFLVSEWTSGFAVLRSITNRTTRTVGNALVGMVRTIGATAVGFGNFIVDITAGLNDLEDRTVDFGRNIGVSLAEGIAASTNVISDVLRGIGRLLAFFLSANSPPRIAPDLDKWGKEAGQEYLDAYAEANPETAMNKMGEVVERAAVDATLNATRKSLEVLQNAQPDVALNMAKHLNNATRKAYGVVPQAAREALEDPAIETAAEDAGISVSEAFVDGFMNRLPQLTPKMSDELVEVLRKIGGGARLTAQGALGFGRFLAGFGEADFGVLDTISGVVQNFYQSLVDTGQIEDVDLPRLLFGAREDLAQGVKDIDEAGNVTESTMQRIRASAGGAGQFVIDLLRAYAPLRDVTEQVEDAQGRLNEITDRYKAIITPLRKELEAISEANRLADDEEKILSLRRLIANEGVSERRRRNAQLEIDQIRKQQEVSALEKQRDTAVEGAEDELAAREKVRDQLEEQFAVLQRQIQAQLDQLGLFAQEGSIIRRLQEEAEKLREKEMTQQELQLKMLELQDEELNDLVAAAKAKYDLDRADATELEKQQAQITLAEVALRRRNREAEAIKLGIPVAELDKMRDFVVTLEDIGVKSKDAFAAPDTTGFGESIVDANAITKEWETTLAQVRDRWNEIKTNIQEAATEINSNLPSFLKIFPEVEGGEPPIIGFIKGYAGALVGLAVVMTSFNIITRIASLVTAIRSLMTVGAIGGAAGAAGAAGSAAGGSAVIAAITSSVVALGVAALATTGFVLGLKAALAGFGAAEEKRVEVNTQQIDETLGDFGPALDKSINDLAAKVTLNQDAKTALADNIVSAATSAIGDEFGNEHVVASIGNAIQRSIAEGLVADTPANRAAITAFQTGLISIIEEKPPGETPKVNILTGAELSATPSKRQETTVKEDVKGFLAGITDEEQKGAFAENMRSLIVDATNLGMSNAQIDTLVFGAFSEGVQAGLVADTPENRTAISKYIKGILVELKAQAEIDSPSKLVKREVGAPIGIGLMEGIGEAINDAAPALRTKVSTLFGGIKTILALRMAGILIDQQANWTAIRTTGEDETATMSTSITTTFGTLLTTLSTLTTSIKNLVVTAFGAMRTDTEAQVLLLRTNVVRMFAGEDGSILDAIELVFLGDEDIVPRNIGKDFIDGIGQGIWENRDNLALVLTDAMYYALGEAQLAFSPASAPIEARVGSRVGSPNSATNVTTNRTTVYQLNVRTERKSQGVVDDYGVMQTLAGS